jgi:hypothetical protein
MLSDAFAAEGAAVAENPQGVLTAAHRPKIARRFQSNPRQKTNGFDEGYRAAIIGCRRWTVQDRSDDAVADW